MLDSTGDPVIRYANSDQRMTRAVQFIRRRKAGKPDAMRIREDSTYCWHGRGDLGLAQLVSFCRLNSPAGGSANSRRISEENALT